MTVVDGLSITRNQDGRPTTGPGDGLDGTGREVAQDRVQALSRSKRAIAGAGVVAGMLTFAVSAVLPPTYTATAHVVVQSTRLGDVAAVNATNEVAGQLAQLAMTPEVLRPATQALGLDQPESAGEVSAGTVTNTNIVRVTVTSADAVAAEQLALGVAEQLVRQVTDRGDQAEAESAATVTEVDDAIEAAEANAVVAREQVAAAGADPVGVQVAVDGLRLAQQQVEDLELKRIDALRLARLDRGPAVTAEAQPADQATRLAPRPVIYAAVAAALAMALTAWWATRRAGNSAAPRAWRLPFLTTRGSQKRSTG